MPRSRLARIGFALTLAACGGALTVSTSEEDGEFDPTGGDGGILILADGAAVMPDGAPLSVPPSETAPDADLIVIVDASSLIEAGLLLDSGEVVDASALLDAGILIEAGVIVDAGSLDAAAMIDAGVLVDAGAFVDAGVLDAGVVVPPIPEPVPDYDAGWFDSDDAPPCQGQRGTVDETWADAGTLDGLMFPIPWLNNNEQRPLPTQLVAVDTADRTYIAAVLYVGGPVLGVRRLLPNGAPDPTFGVVRKVLWYCHNDDCAPGSSVRALLVRTGDVLIGGHKLGVPNELPRDFMLVAVGVDGGTSGSFDASDTASVDFGSHRDEHASSITSAGGGKLVIVGTQEPYSQNSKVPTDRRVAVVRLASDGTIDPTFGTRTYDAGTNATAPVATVAGNRVFVLVRLDGRPSRVMRISSTGVLLGTTEIPASAFHAGTSGVPQPPHDLRSGIVVDSKGRILASDGPITRILPDGTLDPSFGNGGTVQLPYQTATVFLVDSKGRALVWTESGAVRLREDGTVDPAYVPRVLPAVPVGRQAFAKGCRVIQAAGTVRRFNL